MTIPMTWLRGAQPVLLAVLIAAAGTLHAQTAAVPERAASAVPSTPAAALRSLLDADLAENFRREPMWADAGALIVARAHLERFRQTGDVQELADAREALRAIKSAALSARDRVDLVIGLGQALYLGETFGAAADLFDAALEKGDLLSERDRVLLLDWWATSLDREAQLRTVDRRGVVYERIGARMERELRDDPASAVAGYWRVVAARGTGDLDLAWSAAISAWVRSTLNPATSSQLRADLDRVVEQALIPERARTHPARDVIDPAAQLASEWELVKERWK